MGGPINDMDQQYFIVWWYGKLKKNTRRINYQPKIHVLMRKVVIEDDYIKLEDHYRGISMNSDLLRKMVLGSVWKFTEGGRKATPMYITKAFNAQTFQLDVSTESWDYYAPNGMINGQPVIPEEIYSLYLGGEKSTFQNHFIYENLVGFRMPNDSYLFIPTLVLLNSIYSKYGDITRYLLTHPFDELKKRIFDELLPEDIDSINPKIPLKAKYTDKGKLSYNNYNQDHLKKNQYKSDGFNHFPICLYRDNEVIERIKDLSLSIMNHTPVNSDHNVQVPPWIYGQQTIRAEGIAIPNSKNFLCLKIRLYIPPTIPDANLLKQTVVVHQKPGENPNPDQTGQSGLGNNNSNSDSNFDKDELDQNDTPGHDSNKRRKEVPGTAVVNNSVILVEKKYFDIEAYEKNKIKSNDQKPTRSASGDEFGSNPDLGNAKLEGNQDGAQSNTLIEMWLAFKELAKRKEFQGLEIKHYTPKNDYCPSNKLRLIPIPLMISTESDDDEKSDDEKQSNSSNSKTEIDNQKEIDDAEENENQIRTWLNMGEDNRGLLVLHITFNNIEFFIFEIERKVTKDKGQEYGSFRGYSFMLEKKGLIDKVIKSHLEYLAENFGVFRLNKSTYEKQATKFNHCKSKDKRPFINIAINQLKKFGHNDK